MFSAISHEVQEYIPTQLFGLQRHQQWLNMVTQHMQQVQPLTPHQAKAQFLGEVLTWENSQCEGALPFIPNTDCCACVSVSGLVSAFPMFGSSFFYIQSSSNSAIDTPCILAVNQNGLNFLRKDTHVSLTPLFPMLTKSLCKNNLRTFWPVFLGCITNTTAYF